VDAIRHAGHFLARLGEIEAELAARPAHPLLGHGTIHAGTIHGGTAFSVYPAECRVGIERRTLPGETAESAAGQLRALLERLRPELPALDATVVPGLSRPGTEVDPASPLARALAAAIAAGGREPAFRGMTAWVDAAILNEAGIPALCYGPGSIAAAHTADESAPVAEIDEAADVLERLILGFCGS
jgi:acetylornithine deacetylase